MDDVRARLLSLAGYSDRCIAVLARAAGVGLPASPTLLHRHTCSCGDALTLGLTIRNGVIDAIGYEYVGCAALQATASALAELLRSRTPAEALSLDADMVLTYLDGLPENRMSSFECALAAWEEMREELRNSAQ
jgi:NifU-like protein involved in Fe-S cluster formation